MKKKENRLLSIFINLVIPIVVLTRLSSSDYLGAKIGIVVALLFPLVYGIWSFRSERKVNFFSGLGFFSVLLTGVIGLFEFPNNLLALKEASIPFIVGIVLILSQKIGRPLFNELLGELLDFEKIFSAFREKNDQRNIERKLRISNYLLAGAFFVSAVVNFVLAKMIVTSAPGTASYNSELGTLTGISFVVILVPFLIVFALIVIFLVSYIQKKTGLAFEEIVV